MEPAVRDRVLTALTSGRRAVLATVRSDGRPRLVPIAYATDAGGDAIVVYTALDLKPKSIDDPRALARVRDIERRPGVTVLIDFWSEDWSELLWVRLDGTASLLDSEVSDHAREHRRAIDLLRQRYPQYESQRLENRPVIRILVEHATTWSASP